MFEGPKFSRTPKAGLDFIENQQCVMSVTPFCEFANVLDGREVRPHALVGLEHNASDIVRAHPPFIQRSKEQLEAGVLGPIAIGKRHLDNGWVFIDDPAFLSRNAAVLLRAY